MRQFNKIDATNKLIGWIQQYFEENANENTKAIVGISGGVDSSVVAAACVKALGKDRVFGVLMPYGEQSDIQYSYDLCDHLGIEYTEVNIKDAVEGLKEAISLDFNDQANINTPARIRMTTLYAISAIKGGRVANTCNLSEDWVGYATKFGDGAGDFSPLGMLLKREVRLIGEQLRLPDRHIKKIPIDGLCGKTDEENLGFTYEVLDRYIDTGECYDEKVKEKIDAMHKYNLHKLQQMPMFKYN
jgi:NAD+ synthase